MAEARRVDAAEDEPKTRRKTREATVENSAFRPLHERMREDIISGDLSEGSWLKTHDLAGRYGVSTNPIREALHQLSGEGFVVLIRNRGARVRMLDEPFVRNIFDIRALIEPYLIRLFVEQASEADIEEARSFQRQIEAMPRDQVVLDALDEGFHGVMYGRHFNHEALSIRQRHGEVVRALARRHPASPARRLAMIAEHQEILAAVERHDVEGAAKVVAKHARGAERHLIERMRQGRPA
ncbi:GntR family transcriptional regulator [Aurantimonas sp. VKM B-3413]|uniref:GntR family transcriptional regulator n=1 Tax=Aurantimonas sp. VKM B-3413 TaxID=2779401 RepID=UPI001E288A5F|nr:GntR family transcriptional regulator [Aurantimonas sp. VKM B-3413]MCB8840488.1 GntR family transcriptional regulator [Aurantimonas sp. VKM B-3413]